MTQLVFFLTALQETLKIVECVFRPIKDQHITVLVNAFASLVHHVFILVGHKQTLPLVGVVQVLVLILVLDSTALGIPALLDHCVRLRKVTELIPLGVYVVPAIAMRKLMGFTVLQLPTVVQNVRQAHVHLQMV